MMMEIIMNPTSVPKITANLGNGGRPDVWDVNRAMEIELITCQQVIC
jgi:hypothetical protein